MSGAEKMEFVSVDTYLATELFAHTKCEYVDGWIRAMTGATNRHNHVKLNTTFSLMKSLAGQPCQVWDSDTKIRVFYQQYKRFYYPDIQVVSEPNLPTESFQDRPVLVVEVLSPSTRLYDLDEKLTAYTQIPTLQYYLILEQHQPIAILLRRSGDLFERLEFQSTESVIDLPALGVRIAMRDIYNGVSFTPTCVQENELRYEDAAHSGS